MHRIILLTFLSICLTSFSFETLAQDKDKEKIGNLTYKLAAANHEFSERNYRGALLLYREITKVNPGNANALYKTAECHYKLKKYDLALKYINKAKAADPEVSKNMKFFYGKIYHRTEKIDDAISMFEAFLETSSKRTIEYDLATKYLDQCKYAQLLMKEPSDVKILDLMSTHLVLQKMEAHFILLQEGQIRKVEKSMRLEIIDFLKIFM
jgi:thioredoxin-like negative regulator of GroEL